MSQAYRQSYGQRATKYSNIAARSLLTTMERKQSNLCVSVDVTRKRDFLEIVDAVGPYACLIKTHVDIIEDFDPDLIERLKDLSSNHDFMIFEDRKFADIGNTVSLQYSRGIHKIASWSHITNAHTIPGPSIITGLASVGLPLGRGLLLLAEMSSQGNLALGSYTVNTVRMAREHREFVVGFIAQRRMEDIGSPQSDPDEDFLILTPGVGLDSAGDGRGQQYRTPRDAIVNAGCDIIIVGRGIYGRMGDLDIESVRSQAERYRYEGWQAYKDRMRIHTEVGDTSST